MFAIYVGCANVLSNWNLAKCLLFISSVEVVQSFRNFSQCTTVTAALYVKLWTIEHMENKLWAFRTNFLYCNNTHIYFSWLICAIKSRLVIGSWVWSMIRRQLHNLKLISQWTKWPPFRRRYFQTHFCEWSFVFWLKFHWSLFPRFQLIIA